MTVVETPAATELTDDDLRRLVQAPPGAGPGGVLLVARHARVQGAAAFGSANLEHDIANEPDTAFYIASTSKQFVAAAVALLELDGRLDPDEPVARWVPEVGHLGDLRIHHLVHHTSGVRDKYSLAMLGRLGEESVSTDAATMRLLSRQRSLGFEPGSRFLYSNSNYWLLAQIVERCAGEGLAAFADRRLFQPLGMTQTRFRADPAEVVPRRATGYSPCSDGSWRTAEYTLASLGPGGVVSTAGSLARWSAVYQQQEHAELARLLQRTRPLTDGAENNYAYGVLVGPYSGRTLIQHAGGVTGFGAEMLQVPAEGLTVVCLTNQPAPRAAALARAALELVLAPPPRPVQVRPVPSGRAREDLIGTYLEADGSTVLTIAGEAGGLRLSRHGVAWTFGGDESTWAGPVGIEVAQADAVLALRSGDQELRFERVPDSATAPTREQFCGRYRNEELGVTLVVEVAQDRLLVRWPDGVTAPLVYVAADVHAFALPGEGHQVVLHAVRAEDGRVVALRVDAVRAPGIHFIREAPDETGAAPCAICLTPAILVRHT